MLLRIGFPVVALLAFTLNVSADDAKPAARATDEKKIEKGPPADSLLADALALAGKDNKVVFLQFGSPTCGWCKYLDKYHADSDVKRILGQHLVIVKVDIVTNPGGEAMYEKYGEQRGVPAFTFLNPGAKVLADSGDKGRNIGFPYEPKEIDDYFKAFRTACPKLSDADVALLTRKLMENGPKREPKKEASDEKK